MSEFETPQSKGGRARAIALSDSEKSEIARLGASARWNPDTPTATHSGEVQIGDLVIPCAVLDDGTRVLSEHGITQALLGSRSGSSKRLKRASAEDGAVTPVFLAPGNLKPFISQELTDGPLKPLTYRVGTRLVVGYSAEILPVVCDIWLRAREEGALQKQQMDKAQQAEILMRGLAKIGITALVDEATGYQEVRDRTALQAILDAYLQQEFAAWAKRFPDDFYKEIFRLRGWTWRGMKVNRPQVVAKYTNDFVYSRLAPGILEELRSRNPVVERGRRKAAHHQWLSEDVGHTALAQHLHSIVALMKASESWEQLKLMIDRVYPRRTDLKDLPLFSQGNSTQDAANASSAPNRSDRT